jgi:hypothetical protein
MRPRLLLSPSTSVLPILLVAAAFVAVSIAGEASSRARAGDERQSPEWATSLDAACKTARTSGKPVLVVTCWKEGLCHTCDTWRERVPVHDDVQKQFERFELAEWHYDGLGGKVITWTRENGGTSDDPAAQAFVTDAEGDVVERAPDDVLYAPLAAGSGPCSCS